MNPLYFFFVRKRAGEPACRRRIVPFHNSAGSRSCGIAGTRGGGELEAVAEFVLRYADPRGQMHEQVAEAPTEREARERLAQQGYLVYSVAPEEFRSAAKRWQGAPQECKS